MSNYRDSKIFTIAQHYLKALKILTEEDKISLTDFINGNDSSSDSETSENGDDDVNLDGTPSLLVSDVYSNSESDNHSYNESDDYSDSESENYSNNKSGDYSDIDD